MGAPPPKDEPDSQGQDIVEAGVDFDPSPPTASSLCGFKFHPSFSFSFGFHLPALPACLLDPLSCIPIPWISLSCDLANPVSAGWGGGKEVNVDKDSQRDEQDPWA